MRRQEPEEGSGDPSSGRSAAIHMAHYGGYRLGFVLHRTERVPSSMPVGLVNKP